MVDKGFRPGVGNFQDAGGGGGEWKKKDRKVRT